MADPITQTPSSQRVEPGSVNLQPAPWPATVTNESVDAATIADGIITSLNQALSSSNYNALADLFVEDGFWRDHLAASGALRTLEGKDKIRDFLGEKCNLTKVEIDASSDFRKPQLTGFAPAGDVKVFVFFTKITTKHGSGRGVVRVVERDGQYKIWTFFTSLDSLNGHEEPVGPNRSRGVEHGGKPGRKNWVERRQEDAEFISSEPDVLIIGISSSP